MKCIDADKIRSLADYLIPEEREDLHDGVDDSIGSYCMDSFSMKLANAAKNLICEEMGIERPEEDLPNVQIENGYLLFDGDAYDSDGGDPIMSYIYDSRMCPDHGRKFLPRGPLWRSEVYTLSEEWRAFAYANEFDQNDEACWGDCFIPSFNDGDRPKKLQWMPDDNIYGYMTLKLGIDNALAINTEDINTPARIQACLDYFNIPVWARSDEKVRKLVSRSPAIEIEASEYGNGENNELFLLEHVGVEFFESWKASHKRFKKEEKELMGFYEKAIGYMRWECLLDNSDTYGQKGGGQDFTFVTADSSGKEHFLIAGYCGVELINYNYGYGPLFYDVGLNRLSPQFIVAAEIIDSVIRWFDEKYDFIPDDLYLSEETEEDKKVAV